MRKKRVIYIRIKSMPCNINIRDLWSPAMETALRSLKDSLEEVAAEVETKIAFGRRVSRRSMAKQILAVTSNLGDFREDFERFLTKLAWKLLVILSKIYFVKRSFPKAGTQETAELEQLLPLILTVSNA